jgi:hypothetical protein
MTSLITTITYVEKALSLLLITTEEMKIYPTKPSLIEVMIRKDGHLRLAAYFADLTALIKSING